MKSGGRFLTTPVGTEEIFAKENFSEEQRDFLQLSREFALEEIYAQREEIEKYNPELMRSLMRKAGEIGFLGIDVPEEYGGLSLDKVTSAILTESIGLGASASFGVTIAAQTSIGTLPIVFFGTEEQKKKYLPKLVTAEHMSAYCLTEPTAGSDAMSIRTTATLSEDKTHYILNGTKQFITNGGWADIYIVFAKIDGEKFTAFIVERDTPGVQPGKEEYKLGQKGASTTSITFENVPVPVENVLHEIGKGAEVAFNSLNIGRFKLGAADLGGCKAAIKESVAYALERWQFGQPIAHFDALKRKFAEMVINTFALESIIYRTGGLLDQSISEVDPASPNYFSEVANAIENYAIECSICKIFASESVWKTADDGLQVFGGYGFIEDYPMARLLRDARIERLYEGTNEINRQVITGYFLKRTILEQLPIRDAVKEITDIADGNLPKFSGTLAPQMQSLELAKSMGVLLFHHSLVEFGQDLMTYQQLGELLSDIFIRLYVMDTTLSRVVQHGYDADEDDIRVKIAKTLCAERIPEIAMDVEKGLQNILTGKKLTEALNLLQKLRTQLTNQTHTFQWKNEIAEELYKHGEYWL